MFLPWNLSAATFFANAWDQLGDSRFMSRDNELRPTKPNRARIRFVGEAAEAELEPRVENKNNLSD